MYIQIPISLPFLDDLDLKYSMLSVAIPNRARTQEYGRPNGAKANLMELMRASQQHDSI